MGRWSVAVGRSWGCVVVVATGNIGRLLEWSALCRSRPGYRLSLWWASVMYPGPLLQPSFLGAAIYTVVATLFPEVSCRYSFQGCSELFRRRASAGSIPGTWVRVGSE